MIASKIEYLSYIVYLVHVLLFLAAVLLTCTGCTNEGMTAVEVISHQFFKLLDRIEQVVSNKVDAISLIVQSCRIYAMKNKLLCYKDAIWIELKDFISIELLDCIVKIFKYKEAQTILKFLLSRDLSAIIDMIHIKVDHPYYC